MGGELWKKCRNPTRTEASLTWDTQLKLIPRNGLDDASNCSKNKVIKTHKQ